MPNETAASEAESTSEASETTEAAGIAGGEGDESTEKAGDEEPDGISSAGGESDEGSQEGGEDEGKTEDEKAGKGEKDEKDPVLDAVPETSEGYAEVEIQEGLEAADTMLSIYNEGIHKHGLTEGQHKGVLEDVVKPALEHLNAKAEEGRLAMVAGWKTSLSADKVLSTSEAKLQIAAARDGFAKAHPEHAEALMGFLKSTGIQFEPGFNAMFAYTGSLLAEGRMRPAKDQHGGDSGELTSQEKAERMFPKSVPKR